MARTSSGDGGDGLSNSKTSRVLTLAAIFIVVLALRLLREVLIPVALAVLLCFVLAPLASQLERWKVRRIPAVLIVAICSLSIIGVLAYIMVTQAIDLAQRLPEYKENIVYKVNSLRTSGTSSFDKAADALKDVTKAVSEPATTQTTQPTAAEKNLGMSPPPVVPKDSIVPGEDAEDAQAAPLPGTSPDKPLWVAPGEPPLTPVQMVRQQLGNVVGPLGTAGLVIIFMIFMLFQREDLRDRLIRLVGHGQLNLTTTALDDAASRISRYLTAQAMVNGTYGIAVSIGLWIIGATLGDQTFPNFLLWGLLCAVLRFIPYIGPWIGAAFPIAVSFAVYKGSGVFIATCLWFIFIELLSNNLMEPWLYGSSTGMSTVAILVSAVFWTFLWGPVGLLLATPLTVCLVVLGKYVPQLQFLDIMLGDEPVLSPPQRIYQRLLAQDEEEATALVHDYLDEHALEEAYDDLLMPALSMAEHDRHRGRLDEQRQRFVRAAMKNMIDELGDRERLRTSQEEHAKEKARAASAADAAEENEPHPSGRTTADPGDNAVRNDAGKEDDDHDEDHATPAGSGAGSAEPVRRPPRLPEGCVVSAICLPSHDEADEIVGLMLAQLLELRGYCAAHASVASLAAEMLEMIDSSRADVVCVSAMPPAAVTHARYLCKRVNGRYPDKKMVVGLWTYRGDMGKAKDRITCVGSVQVVTTLRDALQQIHQIAQPLLLRAAEGAGRSPPPAIVERTARRE